jgi:hypothetical protein
MRTYLLMPNIPETRVRKQARKGKPLLLPIGTGAYPEDRENSPE